ncbi:hypothetical protein FSP39_004181 [Pinctada imbricata]|uniref:C-type lectin domain-containing protein n=1 Tax=Pinctada imbricata TaxID=66713 RepID=A0AA89BUT7_PINIB|nr:hypothetical protein FSP39_004181 [Pinctada imbricata]
MYENNVQLHSVCMSANKDMKTALEEIRQKTEEQQSKYQNDTERYERINETVEKHDSKLLTIERRNENQQRVIQTTLQRHESDLQDLRQLIQDLKSKVLNMTDELNILLKGSVIVKGTTNYFVSEEKLSWSDAWSFCRKIGAILVHIKNQIINGFLLKSLSKYADDFWIGGELVSGRYMWKTSTGYEPVSWSNWAPGEPNSGGQKCIQLDEYQYHKWDNDYCNTPQRFVCSREQS